MKEKEPKKVMIINDIDSESIERAILILRSGGTPATQTYHIVSEAQELINAYRRTVEKTQNSMAKKERRLRKGEQQMAVLGRILWATGVMAAFIFGGYLFLQGLTFLLEKF